MGVSLISGVFRSWNVAWKMADLSVSVDGFVNRSSIRWLAGVDELGRVVGVGRSDWRLFCCVEVVSFSGCLLPGIFLCCVFSGGNSSPSREGGRCVPEGRDIGCVRRSAGVMYCL